MKNKISLSQEHPLGCAVACVASNCKIQYDEALQLFEVPANAWTRGFYCDEVVHALSKAGHTYTFEKFELLKHIKVILNPGTIVFVAPNSQYPSGHYLLRVQKGWMNSWSNFPQMIPVRSTIEENLPGELSYVIYKKDSNNPHV